MLRFDAKYLTRFNELISTFKQKITQADLQSSYKSQISPLIDTYQSAFQNLVKAQTQLGLDLDSGALGVMRINAEKKQSGCWSKLLSQLSW